ncbi:hypothetical protein CDD83_565 [Cordyceps sp. RAO-2017]|nr:hypothetical protein CDD83_565 [Cordyceps sp. RAO-2017]
MTASSMNSRKACVVTAKTSPLTAAKHRAVIQRRSSLRPSRTPWPSPDSPSVHSEAVSATRSITQHSLPAQKPRTRRGALLAAAPPFSRPPLEAKTRLLSRDTPTAGGRIEASQNVGPLAIVCKPTPSNNA